MILKNIEISDEWHLWFAWYPVPVNDDGDHAWLQMVERRKAPGVAGTVARRVDYRIPGTTFYGRSKPNYRG